ncbi:MAG: hypothetical protein ACYTGL_26685 [Planctomycetota bacterium]|jgi:hypothetical protein
MKNTVILSALLIMSAATSLPADDAVSSGPATPNVPRKPLALKGELLFSDDFDRDTLGEWKVVIPGFQVREGVLTGTQDKADHGAVGRVYRPMKDVIVEFRFRLDGSQRFNVVFDDQKFKGSHAGHICRVSFTPKGIRLGDDKEGIMRNDIFAMRRDGDRKEAADKLTKDRSSWSPLKIEQEKWYAVAIELVGDRMRVKFDGRPVGYLQSPGLAHETKASFHFTVTGPGIHFDDVGIWKAR